MTTMNQMSAVTDLHAARRYLTNVLLYLAIDGESITAHRLLELLDYFAEHPTEYLDFTNGEHNSIDGR